MIRNFILPVLVVILAISTAEAKPRHHHNHSSLVAHINARLARYVHPTGDCPFGTSEQLATYYNSGRRTANGEHFNPGGNTAAHRTLPFGTHLTITNPHNGRTITVRINDRGPFTHAKIDLAQGAARRLGMTQSSYLCISHGALVAED